MRRTRGLPRRDYNALHNGLVSSPSEQSKESACGTGRRYSPKPSPSMNTEDTPRTKQSYSLPSSSPSPLDLAFSESKSNTSSPQPHKRRKTKSYSMSTLGPYIWIALGDGKRFGALWFNFEFTKHRIKSRADSIFLPAVGGSLDRFLKSPRKKASVKEMLVRWVIQTRQPFTVVEHPAFKALIEAIGAPLPIKSAGTVFNRIKEKFHLSRAYVKEELTGSSRTLALSLNITPNFEKRDEYLEFTEINGPHSRENLA
ncbi:hypothetical protein N7537_010448 [Penicillium hordei]|uniref:Uncharacterized protein n=1 Tax=Penicillium hordei TaxID=40994 RepID=A0AAD6DW62_9EURO|nr:uncharacterized protein N7537_010448 [Penicillium hordei]KAJ5593544.1 hypothetical protein N7537_010448 [Penicillium hordei]